MGYQEIMHDLRVAPHTAAMKRSVQILNVALAYNFVLYRVELRWPVQFRYGMHVGGVEVDSLNRPPLFRIVTSS
jgi:hypothetical protein